MRRIFGTVAVVLVLVLASGGVARAACGIGSHIWEGRNGAIPWLLASTTNFWTFKVISTTFGLAGCTDADNWFTNDTDARVRHFASNNFDRLAEEMAKGEGEHLAALAHLLGMYEQDRVHFQGFVQQNFSTLLSHDHIAADEMLTTLASLMAEDERLSAYVHG